MRTWLRLLLVLTTIGGGFTGIVATASLFGSLKDQGTLYALVVLTSFALYAFVTAAGLLFVYDSRRTGPMSVAIAIQIPWVSLRVLEYHFFSACYVALTLGPPQGLGELERISSGARIWEVNSTSIWGPPKRGHGV